LPKEITPNRDRRKEKGVRQLMDAALQEQAATPRGLRVGVDVGGTFTDIILLAPDGRILSKKVLSSPPDFNTAIKSGVMTILSENGFAPTHVEEFCHGATVATNCILTRTGAKTALITTAGFRDVLEIRRMRMHKLYDINWEKPKPLVPRHLRLEIAARTDPNDGTESPLDEIGLQRIIEKLSAEGVESVAVCYLHSYANGSNERRTRDIIRRLQPLWLVSISSEVLPEIKEYERTSTTVINAYVQPSVAHYARALETDLKASGIASPVVVMQSNGGMVPLDTACRFPIHIIESGPAAGVMAAHSVAKQIDLKDVITFDMGGTTAKAAIIEDGEISRSPEYEVGGDISIGHRLMKGSGYLLRVPSIDLAEVSAGGGSIAWLDSVGALKVGPRSAGAIPGPACYSRGGKEPTITDANVHLGLTNPQHLASGTLTISPALAEGAIRNNLATKLGLDPTDVAWAIRSIANASLIRALRAVSIERGRDPRQFVLIAFGGMGPVHALDVAEQLGIEKVVIPSLPGLFSALGLLFAQIEHHLIRTYYADPVQPDLARLNTLVQDLAQEAGTTLDEEGYDASRRTIELSVDLRYVGQDHALTMALIGLMIDEDIIARLKAAFEAEHERIYGYRSEQEKVQIVGLRCVGRGLSPHRKLADRLNVVTQNSPPAATRRCYFGPEHGWIDTAVVSRESLAGCRVSGSAIIEEESSATVINPGWSATLDAWSNIIVEPVKN
jgi:N-methylhydantoinase A